ncbi:hypothetical protein GCM10027589_26550 [Actinocorallia lasiicapitis]
MNTETRLESLVSASVEAEVRGVELPADFLIRITERRRRRAPRFGLLAVGLATATVAVAVPIVLTVNDGQDRVAVVAATPSSLDGKITEGPLPDGYGSEQTAKGAAGWQEADPKVTGVRVWVRDFRAPHDGGPEPLVATVRVLTGDVTFAKAVTAVEGAFDAPHYVDITGSFPRGEAVYRGPEADFDGHLVAWRPRKGLMIVVRSYALTREQTIDLVKGTTVK